MDYMRTAVLGCCLWLAGAGGLLADEGAAPGTSSGQSGQEPTLPPVIVRPEEQPPPAAPERWATDESLAQPYDLPLSYPRLSQQVFGKGDPLDGVTRSEQSLFDIPNEGTIVGRPQLEQKQASDMARALQDEVGVLVQQTARGQASPFLRGLTGQEVLILIDGIRLNNSVFRSGPNQYFNLVDPGQVERIEILRGPQSVLWGSDAIGGAINIVTRSADRDRGNYLGGGLLQYASTADAASYTRTGGEGWTGRLGVFGGASYLNVNDLTRGGSLGVQPFTDYDQYAGDIKFNYLLSPDALVTVALQHFQQRNVPRSDRFAPFVFGPPAGTPRPTWFDPQQRDLAYVRLQGLACAGLFDAYTATLSFARNKEGTREIRSPTRTDLGEFDVDTLGFDLCFAKDLDWLGRLTWGTDFYNDDLDAFRNRIDPTTGAVTPDNPQFPNDSRYRRVGVYLNWDVAVTQRLDAVAGVRYEDDDAAGTINAVRGTRTPFTRTYQDWVGSVGLVYKLHPALHVVGGVYQGFRAPNLDDLTADNPVLQNAQDLPSLDVDSERALTYEVGLKFDAPRLRLQAFEYWTNLDDAILRQAVDAQGNPVPNVIGPYGTLIPGSSSFIRSNFDCYINGTELVGEYLFPEGWSLYGNFWYTFGQDLDRGEPFSRIPPTQGIVGWRWRDEDSPRWFEVFTWLVARQDRYNPQNNIDARFPIGGTAPFATLNVRAGTTLGRCQRHRLSLSLENLTNTPYRVLGSGVDGPGLNAVFGYEWVRQGDLCDSREDWEVAR